MLSKVRVASPSGSLYDTARSSACAVMLSMFSAVRISGPPVPPVMVYVRRVMFSDVRFTRSPAAVMIDGSSGSVSRGRSHALCSAAASLRKYSGRTAVMSVVPVTASGMMVSDVPSCRMSTLPEIVKNAPISHGSVNA